jgi:colanic acid/amylovoran biosynthesis glycosyltransferase
MSNKLKILVYRNTPIKISETFIYNQSIKLSRYYAFLLGAKSPIDGGMNLPESRVKLISEGKVKGFFRELFFKVFGVIPKDIKSWIREINPQLIHAHFGDDGTTVLPIAQKFKIPLIVSFLGTDATLKDKYARRAYLRRRLYMLRRKKLARCVSKVVVPSQFLKNRVIEHGFDEEKIQVIHHGVDLSKFKRTSSEIDPVNVLFVGRLIMRKGLNYLISALAKVKQEFPDVTLTVVGDGPDRELFEQQAQRELGEGFEFLGFQPHDVVRDAMSKACIFSLPSITMPTGECETFGLVFIEAQAMGVPVISFKSGGIPEVVVDGKTGFLCEEGDVSGLAEKILVLLKNQSLRNKMGAAGADWVKSMFDLNQQTAELEKLYDGILQKDKAGVLYHQINDQQEVS